MKTLKFLYLISIFLLITNCKNSTDNSDETESQVTTPVTISSVENTSISEKISMNAVSSFQKKNLVQANINGYIEKVFVNIGDYVPAGKILFTLKTKEAAALGNYYKNDSTLLFKGEMNIIAPSSGIITEITKLTGDYIAEGDQLCIIADQSSFVFLLNVPFELNKYVKTGINCNLLLPDSTSVTCVIISKLSAVDVVSQTQGYIIKPQTKNLLPENLIATVQITKNTRQNAQVVDKNCILTDETMENFWVMKLINDTTAVRIDIKKGISAESKIEIISPQFNKNDRLISSGAYGLADTAYVNIIQNLEQK